jgi:hypothetical protein
MASLGIEALPQHPVRVLLGDGLGDLLDHLDIGGHAIEFQRALAGLE